MNVKLVVHFVRKKGAHGWAEWSNGIPEAVRRYQYHIRYRGIVVRIVNVTVTGKAVTIKEVLF